MYMFQRFNILRVKNNDERKKDRQELIFLTKMTKSVDQVLKPQQLQQKQQQQTFRVYNSSAVYLELLIYMPNINTALVSEVSLS